MDSPLLPIRRYMTPSMMRAVDQRSSNQSHLLNHLRTHVNSVRTMEELVEAVYPDPNDEPEYAEDCIRLGIKRLRARGFDIRTLWGRGYFLFAEKDNASL